MLIIIKKNINTVILVFFLHISYIGLKSFISFDSEISQKLSSKVSSGDRLFGSINSQDLANFFESKGENIEKKYISIPGRSIKRIGKYEATIRLHRDISIQYPFEIIAAKS